MMPTIFCRPEIKIVARNQRNDQSPLLKAIVRLQRKLEKMGKRLSGDDMKLAIVDMMQSQQESIQRSKENDESFFKALLKSRAEAQRQHQSLR